MLWLGQERSFHPKMSSQEKKNHNKSQGLGVQNIFTRKSKINQAYCQQMCGLTDFIIVDGKGLKRN